MKLSPRQTLALVLVPLLMSASGSRSATQSLELSTPEQIKADFDLTPCKNENRLNEAKALFEKMGADTSDISIERYKNVENLIIRKPGKSEEKIIVGAHYDKVSEGCGAIDNWSGIVVLAHLYRSLKDVSSRKTILFIAFGKEETGLVGSRAMVGAIKKDQLAEYCEMINIDSLGLGAPQVADNLSSKKLSKLVADVASEMKMPYGHASIPEAEADSESFISKKIPAVTIHGLNARWRSILHTRTDQPSKINSNNVHLGYQLLISLIFRLDSLSCGEYK